MKLQNAIEVRNETARRLAILAGMLCGLVPTLALLFVIACGNEVLPLRDPIEVPPGTIMFLPPRLVLAALLEAIPGALIAGVAMKRSIRLARESTLVGGILLAGATSVLVGAVVIGARDWVAHVAGALCLGPFVFVLNAMAVFPLTRGIVNAQPSLEQPSLALWNAVPPLSVFGILAAVATFGAQWSWAPFMFAYGFEHAAARHTLWLLPLAIGASAIVCVVVAVRETGALRRTRDAILAGTHPKFRKGDAVSGDNAIPLTERDRKGAGKHYVTHRSTSPYRDGERRETSVYVADTQPSQGRYALVDSTSARSVSYSGSLPL